MTVLLAAVVPFVAVWASVEAIRTAPIVLEHRRTRRRLVDLGGWTHRREGAGRRSPRVRPASVVSRSRTAVRTTSWLTRPVRRLVDDHRGAAIDRAVPDRLDRVVRRLRTGDTLPTAIAGLGIEDEVVGSLAADLGRGRSLVGSVGRWRAADPRPNRRLAAVALELTADAGGASAPVLDGVAESLRDRVALEREVTALSSQARASAALLVIAPLAFAFLAGSVDRRILATLFGTPIGWACVVLGIILDGLGALWMSRLLRRHR